jgi:hypothetical protein
MITFLTTKIGFSLQNNIEKKAKFTKIFIIINYFFKRYADLSQFQYYWLQKFKS